MNMLIMHPEMVRRVLEEFPEMKPFLLPTQELPPITE